jgi:SAM-dependent methyltransferase
MESELTFRDYVLDAEHMKQYSEYQRKYSVTIRESDKVLIEMVRQAAAPAMAAGTRPRVLDIGCSTGNLLLHLNRMIPGLTLTGGDMAPAIIAECRANAALAGIEFAEMNMLELDAKAPFDIVVANAAMMFFDPAEFARAAASIGGAIKPGGAFLAFDLFHPFEQEVEIVETTTLHPRGLKFHFRSYKRVREAWQAARLAAPELVPFNIPIDLPLPADPSDVTTYTVSAVDGRRLSLRGTLYQPWCHVSSRKPA